MKDQHLLAAKFAGRGKPPAYHPLLCHMVDVAAVAEELWDGVLPASTRRLLTEGLGLDEENAREWVAFVAGAHDVGKATREFQAKDAHHKIRLAPGGLTALPVTDPGHGVRTAALLPDHLATLGVAMPVATQLSIIAGGHHGQFHAPDRRKGSTARALNETPPEVHNAWSAARKRLFDDYQELFHLGTVPAARPTPPAGLLLAGLISVADWIGSIEERFEWDPEGTQDLRAYFDRVRAVARAVLIDDRWSKPPAISGVPFAEMFPFASPPRPLQQQAEKLGGELIAPALVVVEAPMGEGKTEAALYIAHQWQAGGTRGSYIALPTQATANQMHGRVGSHLPPDANLVLAHGGAWLQTQLQPADVHGDESSESTAAAAEWFLKSKKRALLAPFGVGTVDQALMAVLQVRHVFVRLFGLAGKTVVIDEVHAYDTYMTGLLERLLEWLAALGSPVILLSATLPTNRRQRLVQAYANGLGMAPTEQPDAPYPRISWLGRGSAGSETFETSDRTRRTLRVERISGADDALVANLEAALAEGGCAAVICNTVGRAQQLYTLLSNRFRPGHELGLFHARFLMKDRRQSEDRFVGMFGPPSDAPAERPARYVLVATQVIEQSLDVDFDVMFTELAPVDLLLQRSGRLQRHERADRGGGAPTLRILWPQIGQDGLPLFDPGSKAVYDEHILLRTWHALQGTDTIEVPGNLQRLVDLVYRDDEATPVDASADLADAWRGTWQAMKKKQEREEAEAKLRRLGAPTGKPSIERVLQHPREEDEDLHPALQAVTRLGDPTFNLVLLEAGMNIPVVLDREAIVALIDRSVSTSHKGLVAALQDIEPLPQFQRHAALRRYRLAQLDEQGTAAIGRFSVRYSPDLGLEILREEDM